MLKICWTPISVGYKHKHIKNYTIMLASLIPSDLPHSLKLRPQKK